MAASSSELSTAEKLRMDRQLHALGEKMVIHMKNARVLISGLGGLGVEIAKNVALAGCKTLMLHDTAAATHLDLATQFYLTQESVGQNRATASAKQVGELNPFCPVVENTEDLWAKSDAELSEFLKGFACVVLTEAPLSLQVRVDGLCHAQNVSFVTADVRGLFCAAFVDAGQRHEVWDDDGEAPFEVLLSGVTPDNAARTALVRCLEFEKSPFSEGQQVTFREVRGLEALNAGSYRVKSSSYSSETKTGSFEIELGSELSGSFQAGSGRAVQNKVAVQVSHQTLASLLDSPGEKLLISDYAKFDGPAQIHTALRGLHRFWEAQKRLPQPWNAADADAVVAAAKEINAAAPLCDPLNEGLVRALAHTAQGSICPLTGFLGGFISQEVLKLISGKFTPLNQLFYIDLLEVLPQDAQYTPSHARDEAQRICLGQEMCSKLAHARIFTVGAGAIGCELMKNYAMMNIATQDGGEIIVTDDDRIELSNLNRQFLFRDKDLGQPKSTTAAGVARLMNPAIRIAAHERRVEKKSEDLFSNKFYEGLDCIINALDNVQARQYVDARCVENQRPLVDSGTLSSKGHVQVVVPFKTETYGSQSDPASQEVPFCTIKSFPHDISHCIQWARDLCFELQFATRPNRWNKLFGLPDPVAALRAPDAAALRPDIISKMITSRPQSFEDCVRQARIKWEKTFVHAPSDLLHAFPLDMKTKEGTPFWSSPKRPPHPLAWDSADPLYLGFVTAFANLLAFVYSLPQNRDAQHIAAVADATQVPAWAPKSKEIETDESKKAPQEDQKKNKLDSAAIKAAGDRVAALLGAGGVDNLQVVEFEKDDDSNFHIDCIHFTANLRARVYSIDEISRMDTKRIAGRILPALATTTSCVSGWAMAQFLAILAGGPIESYKNTFLNLALPLFQMSEPGPTRRIGKEGSFYDTIWDQWAIHDTAMTIQGLLNHVRDKYAFEADSIFLDGSITVHLGFLHGANQARLNRKVIDSFPDAPPPDADFVLLTLIPPQDDEEEEEEEEEDKPQDGAVVRFYLH